MCERARQRRTADSSFFHQVWSLFNRRERWQLAALSVALVVRAAVEMIGIASIMPFMGVVADPELIQANRTLAWAFTQFGFDSPVTFTTALGLAVVAFLILANGFSALTLYGMTRFSWGMHHRLAMRLLQGYLRQPYSFFTQRNSASFNKTLLNECQVVIANVIEPTLNAIAKTLVVCAIVTLLVVTDPVLALVVVVLIGGSYAALYLMVKSQQRRLGRVRVAANEERFKITGEVFGGIKDVKILQREDAFVERFQPASYNVSMAIASNAVIAKIPRYFFEAIALAGIVLIVVYNLQASLGVAEIIPVLSLYAFAGYRLMPELQQLFNAAAQIRFNRAALDDLTADLEEISKLPVPLVTQAPLPFTNLIDVDNVTFRYPGVEEDPALNEIHLTIKRNQTIGIVGASGSGKTTLVDLLLGLYEPTNGRILIDATPLDQNSMSAWRRQIGYVPQHIYLTDDTIAANIAFGMATQDIDQEQVEHVAKIANLHEFIQSLPQKYATVVGERGVRLSGGQRQRIGISRALYHDPAVLIMDEATSALDGATEQAVMDAIRDLAGKKTIILIAHRLSTVKSADVIWMLEQGKTVDFGTYESLLDRNTTFRKFAGLDP